MRTSDATRAPRSDWAGSYGWRSSLTADQRIAGGLVIHRQHGVEVRGERRDRDRPPVPRRTPTRAFLESAHGCRSSRRCPAWCRLRRLDRWPSASPPVSMVASALLRESALPSWSERRSAKSSLTGAEAARAGRKPSVSATMAPAHVRRTLLWRRGLRRGVRCIDFSESAGPPPLAQPSTVAPDRGSSRVAQTPHAPHAAGARWQAPRRRRVRRPVGCGRAPWWRGGDRRRAAPRNAAIRRASA